MEGRDGASRLGLFWLLSGKILEERSILNMIRDRKTNTYGNFHHTVQELWFGECCALQHLLAGYRGLASTFARF